MEAATFLFVSSSVSERGKEKGVVLKHFVYVIDFVDLNGLFEWSYIYKRTQKYDKTTSYYDCLTFDIRDTVDGQVAHAMSKR